MGVVEEESDEEGSMGAEAVDEKSEEVVTVGAVFWS